MAAALLAHSRELLGLVAPAPLANELGVRIVGRPRLGALAADDAQPLLRKMRTRKMVGQVSGREDQGAVGKGNHQQTSRALGGVVDATESSRARVRQTRLIVALIPSAWSFSAS